MIRLILFNLFLFSLPFIMLALWLWWFKRTRPDQAEIKIWAYASLAGFACMLAGLLYFRSVSDAPTGSVYVPASVENGQLVPGHFEKQDAPKKADEELDEEIGEETGEQSERQAEQGVTP